MGFDIVISWKTLSTLLEIFFFLSLSPELKSREPICFGTYMSGWPPFRPRSPGRSPGMGPGCFPSHPIKNDLEKKSPGSAFFPFTHTATG